MGREGVNKNQTAAERYEAAQVLTNKVCAKCGERIKLADLLTVVSKDFRTKRKSHDTYHRKCYGI